MDLRLTHGLIAVVIIAGSECTAVRAQLSGRGFATGHLCGLFFGRLNSYGCGSLEAMPVEVPVYAELLPGTLAPVNNLSLNLRSVSVTPSRKYSMLSIPGGGAVAGGLLVFNANGQEVMVETQKTAFRLWC